MTVERWLNLFALDLLFVLLVVLILFMAITPILPFRVYVDVPESAQAIASPDFEGDLTVDLPTADLTIVENVAIPPLVLDQKLASAWRDRANVRIRAGRRVPFGDVRRVVQAAQRAGITRVTIVLRAPQPLIIERFDAGWSCPPLYGWIAAGLAGAAVAIGGAVLLAVRRRAAPWRPGCAGWLLLAMAALALLIAWDAARPSCGWWY